jgi:hypothetical protein
MSKISEGDSFGPGKVSADILGALLFRGRGAKLGLRAPWSDKQKRNWVASLEVGHGLALASPTATNLASRRV